MYFFKKMKKKSINVLQFQTNNSKLLLSIFTFLKHVFVLKVFLIKKE